MKRPELLAPAGSFQAFEGAVNAGADAVYLGGQMFSARAAAQNFTQDELLRALDYAHKRNRKIYMTVNTLFKEREMKDVIPFLTPFVAAGLDGVIVQDFGVVRVLKESFPSLKLHASTQMMVTGVFGTRLLKSYGVERVVPARELTLKEIAAIRERADIEVEAFVHGAMCYCYSGNCLFSGIVGGRSGNRGRCAQACRLPYQVRGSETGRGTSVRDGAEMYPLSLKDMNTISDLPALIDAGIDSFKIEGRMKRPEYASGVTAVYRKYIDRYLEHPGAAFFVEDEDMETLKKLYLRTSVSNGYLYRHNGAEMVTMDDPGYGRGESP